MGLVVALLDEEPLLPGKSPGIVKMLAIHSNCAGDNEFEATDELLLERDAPVVIVVESVVVVGLAASL
jgi:hypothetical protein